MSKNAAQKPFLTFLILLVVFAAVSLLVFLGCQNTGTPENSQTPLLIKESFNAEKAEKYRQVFEIIKERRQNQNRQSSDLSFPNVFETIQEPAQESVSLTESAN